MLKNNVKMSNLWKRNSVNVESKRILFAKKTFPVKAEKGCPVFDVRNSSNF